MAKQTIEPAGLVSYSIAAGGEDVALLNDTYQVLSIAVEKGVNLIGTARLELFEMYGDPATAEFSVTDSNTFKPGTSVEVSLGYDNVNQQVFKGIVTNYQLEMQGAQGVKIVVSCKDSAVKLTTVRQTRGFKLQPVSDTITEILGTYSDLGLKLAIAATTDPEQAVQRDMTDWDYIVTRAEAKGQVVVSDGGTFTTLDPTTAPAAALVLDYGTNLYDCSLEIDARTQLTSVTAQTWLLDTSPASGKALTVTAQAPTLETPGNLDSSDLAAALSQSKYALFATADIEEGPLQKLTNALLARRALALLRGTAEMPGTYVAPGSFVNLNSLGERFSGDAFVAKIEHHMADGDWKTTLTLGLDEKSFAETRPDLAPPAEETRVLTGGDGLCKGVVKAIQPDPGGKYRVQVTIPDFNNAELWARLVLPYATADAGLYFFPEVGDQVLVGFLGGASSSPVVLGSLYTKGRKPAYTPDEKNIKKAIVTNSKLTLEFDDDQKIITLKTPAGNTLVISDADGGKGLKLTDQQENTITLSDKGVAVVSKSTLSLTADQDVTIESTGGKISLKAAQDVTLKGLNVSATADAGLTLKGMASAELSASGNTTVKGVMVMIN